MKHIVGILLVITLITGFASLGYAQNPGVKLGRGVINTLTGIWELPINVLRTYKSEGGPKGLSIGVTEGFLAGLYRTMIGVYEVVTFPFPVPPGYEAITDPPTLLTYETLEEADPASRKDFRPLSSEYEEQTPRSRK